MVRASLLRLSAAARDRAALVALLDLPAPAGDAAALGPVPLAQDVPAQAEDLAKRVRRALGDDEEPIGSLRQAMRRLGVPTFLTDLGNETVDGITWRDGEGHAHAAGKVRARGGKLTALRMTFAHELCHALFDGTRLAAFGVVEQRSERAEGLEQRANAFAAHLLAPRSAVVRFCRERGLRDGERPSRSLAWWADMDVWIGPRRGCRACEHTTSALRSSPSPLSRAPSSPPRAFRARRLYPATARRPSRPGTMAIRSATRTSTSGASRRTRPAVAIHLLPTAEKSVRPGLLNAKPFAPDSRKTTNSEGNVAGGPATRSMLGASRSAEASMFLTRTLEYTPPGPEEPRSVTVSIGTPEPDPLPGGDFQVLVEISGFAEPYTKHFFGVDPIQALLLALGIVPDLVRSLAGQGARVTWLGSEDLGFRYMSPQD